jgi:GNAT superfamily N-acetyltransferase
MVLTRSVVAAAGLLAAPMAPPALPAPAALSPLSLSAPSLSPTPLSAGAPAPVAADPIPLSADPLVARGWIRNGPWLILLREGRDSHGRRVLCLDALDADAPERGTVGHADMLLQGPGAAAVLDGPLSAPTDPSRLPPGAAGADLSHWREHLWFGLAVTPAHRGRGLGDLLMSRAAALAASEGASELIVYATESSRGFYLSRFSGKVLADEPFTGADEAAYHRLVVSLRP